MKVEQNYILNLVSFIIVLSVFSSRLLSDAKNENIHLESCSFFSIILLIGIISSSSYASVQQQSLQSNQFPSTIIAASSSDTAPHALKLKATQQGEEGEPRKGRGFKIDLTNALFLQLLLKQMLSH